ncbi:MAG: multiubiquitin domain-containing protein [Solirubrobacteraceae bacterium]|jgi:hypothetical protein
MTVEARPDDERGKHPKPVMITVNNRPVEMPTDDATGAEIKQHAEVPADFHLYSEHGQKLEPVGDDEQLELHDGERFRAVSGQDVS